MRERERDPPVRAVDVSSHSLQLIFVVEPRAMERTMNLRTLLCVLLAALALPHQGSLSLPEDCSTIDGKLCSHRLAIYCGIMCIYHAFI